jgi:hypothetical protein
VTLSAGLNLGLKALLLAMLAVSVASEAPHLEGKAMAARALTYPLAVLAVPAGWWACGCPRPYPHGLDALIALPFAIDVAGNLANLYAGSWFDRVAHLANWAILTTACGALLCRLPIGRLAAAGLALGFGSVTHTLWELVEYVVMSLGASGLQLTYGDTIGDLALSLAGSAVGAGLTATVVWRRRPV